MAETRSLGVFEQQIQLDIVRVHCCVYCRGCLELLNCDCYDSIPTGVHRLDARTGVPPDVPDALL